MATDSSLFSGSMTMLVLKLLEEKDMYGYEMIDTLAQRSNNVFEMRAGTLYPLLRNLVNQKCLTSYEEEVNGKLRKYYSLTLIGRKVLEEKQKTWHEYSSAVISVIGNA
jgi:DNA-binding PadR family transcriptional regulator